MTMVNIAMKVRVNGHKENIYWALLKDVGYLTEPVQLLYILRYKNMCIRLRVKRLYA